MKPKQKEEWRDIGGYEGYYQVSNYGRVKSLERLVHCKNRAPYRIKERYIKTNPRAIGNYCNLGLNKGGIKTNKYLHRLVAEAFILKPSDTLKLEVNHIDGDKLNNTIDNLEWVTAKHNNNHARDTLRVMEAGCNPNKVRVLLPEDIHTIFYMRNKGHTLKSIGDTVGTHFGNVSSVLLGKTWKKYAKEQGLKVT